MSNIDADDLIDDMPIGFGKYAESTPNQIAEEDPAYLVWGYDEGLAFCSRALALACETLIHDNE